MRLELFGAIALTTLVAAACGGSDDQAALGASTTTGGAVGAGGSATGAVTGNGGLVTTGNGGGNQVGNGGSQFGNGGSQFGNGGSQQGNGGAQQGNGGTGAGGVGQVVCPATQPTSGDACTGRGTCTFGGTSCFCARSQNGGGTRAWRCFTAPDGGFPQPGTDGGFTPPTSCTAAADCTTSGNVCCGGLPRGGNLCLTSAMCTQFGGTPVP